MTRKKKSHKEESYLADHMAAADIKSSDRDKLLDALTPWLDDADTWSAEFWTRYGKGSNPKGATITIHINGGAAEEKEVKP